MGRFVIGLVIGLMVGLIFSDEIFPEGFNNAVQHWGENLRSKIPGR